MIYSKVSQSDLYHILANHSYCTLSHIGINELLRFLWDEADLDDEPTLINPVDLMMQFHEDDLASVLDEYNLATLEQLEERTLVLDLCNGNVVYREVGY